MPSCRSAATHRQTWELTWKRRDLNRERAKRNTKYQYLTRRGLTCGLCGMKLRGHASMKRTKTARYIHLYYQCPTAGGTALVKECNLPRFRVKDVDGAVWRWIEGLILDLENLALALRELQAESQRANPPLQERLCHCRPANSRSQRAIPKTVGPLPGGTISKRNAHRAQGVPGKDNSIP